jgi:hypothetical protein
MQGYDISENLLIVYTGLCPLFSWRKQHITIGSLQTRPRKPDTLIPPFRQAFPISPLILHSHPAEDIPPRLSQTSYPQCLSHQPATTRFWGYRHSVSAVGSCTMDKAQEDERTSVFGGWQTKLWCANVYISLCFYCSGNVQRNNFNF